MFICVHLWFLCRHTASLRVLAFPRFLHEFFFDEADLPVLVIQLKIGQKMHFPLFFCLHYVTGPLPFILAPADGSWIAK